MWWCLCSGVLFCHIWLKWNTFFYRLLTLVLKLEPTTLGTYGCSLSLCLIAVFIDGDIAEKLRTGIGEPEWRESVDHERMQLLSVLSCLQCFNIVGLPTTRANGLLRKENLFTFIKHILQLVSYYKKKINSTQPTFLPLMFWSLVETFIRKRLFSSSSGSCHDSDATWQEIGHTCGAACSCLHSSSRIIIRLSEYVQLLFMLGMQASIVWCEKVLSSISSNSVVSVCL